MALVIGHSFCHNKTYDVAIVVGEGRVNYLVKLYKYNLKQRKSVSAMRSNGPLPASNCTSDRLYSLYLSNYMPAQTLLAITLSARSNSIL